MNGSGRLVTIPWMLAIVLVATPFSLVPGAHVLGASHGVAAGVSPGPASWNGEEAGWTSFHGGSGANGSYSGYFPWTHFREVWTQTYANTSRSTANALPVPPQSSPIVFDGSVYLENSNLPVVLQVNSTTGTLSHAYSLYQTTGQTATVASTPLIASVHGYPYLTQGTYSATTHYTYSLNLSANAITYCHSGQPTVGGSAAIPGGFVQPTMPYNGNPNGIYIFGSWNLGNNTANAHCSNVAVMTSTDAFYDTPSVGETYNPANTTHPWGAYFLSDQSQSTVDAFPVGGGGMLWSDNLGAEAYGSLALRNVSYNDSGTGTPVSAPIGFIANLAPANETSNVTAVDVNCGVAPCFSGGNTSNVLPNGTFGLPIGGGGINGTVALRSLSAYSTQVLYATVGGYLGSVTAHLTGTSLTGPNSTAGYGVTWGNAWRFNSSAGIAASPAVANGLVADGDIAGHVFILNASTGAMVWNGTLPGAILASPAVDDGNFYFLTSTGVLADIGAVAPTASLAIADPVNDTAPVTVSVHVNGTSYPSHAPISVVGAPVTVLATGGVYPSTFLVGSGATSAQGVANLTWTPPYSPINQTYNFTAYVNASGYLPTLAHSNTTALPPPPLAILSFTAAPPLVQVGNSTNFDTSVQGGFLPYTYLYHGLPGGCTSRNLSVLPCAPTLTGNFTVEVTVTDPAGNYQNDTTPLNVTMPAHPRPVVSSFRASPSTIVLGSSTNLTANVTGGTLPYSYTYTALPPGCTTADRSILQCRPTKNGTYRVDLLVSDVYVMNATANTTLTVLPPTVSPLTVSVAAGPSSIILGNSTTFTAKASGGVPPYVYAYTGLPGGCASQDLAQLTCRPNVTGNFTITVKVTDADQRIAASSTDLEVSSSPVPLSISRFTASPSVVTEGNATQFTVVAAGGVPPYSYFFVGLPKGCVTQDAASFSCIPTVTGNFTVNVTVSDAAGHRASASVALRSVASSAPPSPPSVGKGGTPWFLYLLVLLVVAILLVLVALYRRRRRPAEGAPANASTSPSPPQPGGPASATEGSAVGAVAGGGIAAAKEPDWSETEDAEEEGPPEPGPEPVADPAPTVPPASPPPVEAPKDEYSEDDPNTESPDSNDPDT